MGQITLDQYLGGAVHLTPSVNTSIVWWHNRRVQSIVAQNAGLTMTIQPANAYPNMPWGIAFYIFNPKGSTHTFTLRDTPGLWSVNMIAGRCLIVSRVKLYSVRTAVVWTPRIVTVL